MPMKLSPGTNTYGFFFLFFLACCILACNTPFFFLFLYISFFFPESTPCNASPLPQFLCVAIRPGDIQQQQLLSPQPTHPIPSSIAFDIHVPRMQLSYSHFPYFKVPKSRIRIFTTPLSLIPSLFLILSVFYYFFFALCNTRAHLPILLFYSFFNVPLLFPILFFFIFSFIIFIIAIIIPLFWFILFFAPNRGEKKKTHFLFISVRVYKLMLFFYKSYLARNIILFT